MMRQSAARCSLFETVCSARRGSTLVAAFAPSFFSRLSVWTFSSVGCFCSEGSSSWRVGGVTILASTLRCCGVVAKTRFALKSIAPRYRHSRGCIRVRTHGREAARKHSRPASIAKDAYGQDSWEKLAYMVVEHCRSFAKMHSLEEAPCDAMRIGLTEICLGGRTIY